MTLNSFVRTTVAGSLASLLWVGCGPGDSVIGGGNTPDAGAPTQTPVDAGTNNNNGTCNPAWLEVCDGIDNNCDGKIDEGFDNDMDGFTTCATTPDCDDTSAAIKPGAVEIANGKDDNCDGKVDLGADGVDYDQDGTAFPADCNDEEPLVGPTAIEVGGDMADNDCNGQIDEVVNCETSMPGATAQDFARAMGLCGPYVQNVQFIKGNAGARAIRSKLGSNFTPKEGAWMIHLSSGEAKDKTEDGSWSPQTGRSWGTKDPHPLWAAPNCGPGGAVTEAEDLVEVKITMKVPTNAKSFSYQLNFFSAEYPEWVCTRYNDRFIAIMESEALEPAKLPGGATANCLPGTAKPNCNISFDAMGQPLTINNGFFDICSGTGCTKPESMLAGTGYESGTGGATGWLTTKAPVKPGETMTLRFIILDEGDAQYDSAVLIDNFKWELQTVDAPSTVPIN